MNKLITLTRVPGRTTYYRFIKRDGGLFLTVSKRLAITCIWAEYGTDVEIGLISENRKRLVMTPVTKEDLMKARGSSPWRHNGATA